MTTKSLTRRRYDRVNATWPDELPPLTGPEAITAFRRLFRHMMKRPWQGKVEMTSGNRHSRPRRGTYYLNPEGHHRGGWHDLVHDLSHYLHRRLYPGNKPHDPSHAAIEREMIAYVIANGWLDGKLKRAVKPKTDLRQVRAERVAKRLKAWMAKKKRAETAIKKLRRQQRYYERAVSAKSAAIIKETCETFAPALAALADR